jgi:hypothetical protein
MSSMPQTLQPGDAIKIGDTYFVVEQIPEQAPQVNR